MVTSFILFFSVPGGISYSLLSRSKNIQKEFLRLYGRGRSYNII